VSGRIRRATTVLAVAATVGTTAGCWVTDECSGFAIDFAVDTHGQTTPLAAVEEFSHQGIASVPGSGWRQVSTDDAGVRLRSGDATVHVMPLPDGTWVVDSGTTC
jgi:hypothetical protein